MDSHATQIECPNLSSKIPVTDVSVDHYLNNITSPQSSIFLAPTDSAEVVECCSALRSSASPGCDDIKPNIVKTVKHLIAPMLVHIYNLSIPLVLYLISSRLQR